MTKRDSSFNLKKVQASSVMKSLNGVKFNKATGIDKISNRILKMAAPVIYKNLTDLFNISITSGVFPSDGKIAKVSGDFTDANNYRPISVLPTIARVFERLIHRMQIWRTTRLAPGTSMKVRLVRPRCFVLTILPLKSLAWTV